MKNKVIAFFSALAIFCGCACVLTGDANQIEKEIVEVEPLIINSRVPEGTYKGTVIFNGYDVLSYEGTIRVVFEGDHIRIICDDARKSDLPDHL